jgi:dolichol-phosphate mannosyltransferase
VILALPAYNEEAALPLLLAAYYGQIELGLFRGRAVVVDDGSSDGTAQFALDWASRLPVELVRHTVNRGLGETISDALRVAADSAAPDDVIVTMDADNTHPVELIPQMVEKVEAGFDVVIASRYRPGARVVGLSRYRNLLSSAARLLLSSLTAVPNVRDYTCGFRAYRAGLIQDAIRRFQGRLVTERSFACMVEILLKLDRLGARMCEVPLVLRYDRKGGSSKMRVFATVLATLAVVTRHRLSRPASAQTPLL